jgi:type IV pilus assembly protein PilC
VLPGYERVFIASGVSIPFFTRVLLNASRFLIGRRWVMGAAAFTFIIFIYAFMRCVPGRWLISRVRLSFPLYRLNVNLRFTQSLSLLLSSGLSVTEAMPRCADAAYNAVAARCLRGVARALHEGRSLGEALSEHRFIDPLVVEMADIGERTGRLAQTVAQCKNIFIGEYSRSVKRLNKLIEPLITAVLGFVLGMVMLAVILPAFSLTEIF